VTAEPDAVERRAPRQLTALALWAVLAGLQILVAFALAGSPDEDDAPIYEWATAVNALIIYGVLVLLTVWIGSLYPSSKVALGLRRFPAGALWGAAGVVVASVILAVALEPLLHAGDEQGLTPTEWEPERLGPFVVNAILITTWGPFAEELFYRGLGVKVLGVFGGAGAIAISALAFGLAHGLLVALPALVFFGLGLAWVRHRSDSVWPGFLAHALYNAIGLTVAVAAF
jgi:membrane protease YdiL (CAAX protease family)